MFASRVNKVLAVTVAPLPPSVANIIIFEHPVRPFTKTRNVNWLSGFFDHKVLQVLSGRGART